ncbi:hypothetical protein BDY19DRAFT_666009 [Irpex rosettiformis]|uniref:Uncharacterized protein n=1 Tax=Irpex rosettiformis TaxID=378272 RepID=A0ACB8U976_9APHY|nr:hypothetical protein BDY19DRAFT_666009 [Irpex rosettiformis]
MKSAANTIQGVRKGRAKPCDVCRRRKVKCDGNASNSTACSSCKSLKVACTYNGSRDTEGYIKNLELEVQRLKSTLGKVCTVG